jgi:hypothetical protein
MKEFKVILSLAFLLTMLVPLTQFEICSLKYASIYAQTIDQCSQLLISAEEKYQLGKWNESIELIEKCLTKPNLSEIEKGKTYRILSLVYIAMQSEKEANNAVKNLLIMVPNYKIQPDKDPPSLQKYIDDITHTLTPEINFILPRSIEQNAGEFTMTVNGSNFVYGSKVLINGKGRVTTFISDTLLQAKFSASDMLVDDEYEITVYSPILNGRISNPKKFVVKSSSISLWEWFALGTVAITLVVTAINLLKPDPDPRPIAEPPARP